MQRPVLIAACLGLVVACAAQKPASEETSPVAPVSPTGEAAGSTSHDVTAETEGEVVEFTEPPDVPASDAPPIEVAADRDEIICQLERRTGTNRKVRVCRPRSGNPADTAAAKQTFDTLRRSQQFEN